MLLNDTNNSLESVANAANTRVLYRAVERHHQNNPQSSMEAAFEYIMLNSATFRALPTACIEKARKHLALPETVDKQVLKTDTKKVNELFDEIGNAIDSMGLRDNLHWINISPSPLGFYVPESMGVPSSDELRIKTKVSGPQVESSPTYPGSESMIRPKPKPSTTVVHAERVVVDNKKMIKILKFENVRTKDSLPSTYLRGFPVFYTLGAYVVLSRTNGDLIGTKQFYENDVLSCNDFDQMIKTMKEAAARLTKINKTAKLEREHSGKFTVSI